MIFACSKDAVSFREKFETWLKRKISEHNLFLKILYRAIDNLEPGALFFSVTDDAGNIKMLAVKSLGQKIVISEDASRDVLHFFADQLIENGIEVPGVLGAEDSAKEFIQYYTSKINKDFKVELPLLLYSTREVIPPKNVAGEFLQANVDDIEYVAKNLYDFARESLAEHEHKTLEEDMEKSRKQIEHGDVFIWKVNGVRVASLIDSNVGYMSRIGGVYTIPEYRGKGYAAALTAAATQFMLDKGCEESCLYTDANNKTSNGVYQRIGYKLVSVQTAYWIV